MADVRSTEKPNVLSVNNDYGESDATSPADSAPPPSSDDNSMTVAEPWGVGTVGPKGDNMAHNSEWIDSVS